MGVALALALLEVELEPDEPPVVLGVWFGAPAVGERVDEVEASPAGAAGRFVEYGPGEAWAAIGHLGSDPIRLDLNLDDDRVRR